MHKIANPGSIKEIIIFLIFLLSSCSENKIVSLSSLLSEMTDSHAVTYLPDPWYNLKQFSSYDRLSTAEEDDGWFANSDYTQFCRVDSIDGRREFVLFDHNGPGAIVRWWMTFAGEGSHEGIIRVYLDNSPRPVIEGDVLEVLSGHMLAGEPLSSSVSPGSDYYQRGHNLYLPIPYQRGCIVTYECDAIREENGRMRPSVYYNINYRAYGENTKVISFSAEQLEAARPLLEKTSMDLMNQGAADKTGGKAFLISPGESIDYNITARNRAVSSVKLRLSAVDIEQALRSTVIKATFDGNQTICVPAGEFFGTGTMISPYRTMFSETDESGNMEFKRVMPFRKRCEFMLINYGDQTVEGEFSVTDEPYRWRAGSMYFGASWHEYNAIKAAGSEYVGGTGDHFDINFIDINGRGVYAGDEVTVYNTEDAWWGEGDEKIYVDNEQFPSSFGTGTEDYYGYAWCRPETFSHPFIAQPRGDGNFHPGLTINLRHRVLDAIPFRENISSNIELWHWAPAVINYALTTWWYILPGYSTNHTPDIEAVTSPVASKRTDLVSNEVDEQGILEGERIEVMLASGGNSETQFITSWDWSEKGQLWWFGGKPGDTLYLRFKIGETGRYSVSGRLTMAPDYGIVKYFMNNIPSIVFNGYSMDEKVVDVNLGEFVLPEGENIITLVIEGKSREAKEGYMAGIDRLRFERLY